MARRIAGIALLCLIVLLSASCDFVSGQAEALNAQIEQMQSDYEELQQLYSELKDLMEGGGDDASSSLSVGLQTQMIQIESQMGLYAAVLEDSPADYYDLPELEAYSAEMEETKAEIELAMNAVRAERESIALDPATYGSAAEEKLMRMSAVGLEITDLIYDATLRGVSIPPEALTRFSEVSTAFNAYLETVSTADFLDGAPGNAALLAALDGYILEMEALREQLEAELG